MIKATLVGDDKLKAWLETAYPRIKGELNQSMARLVITLTRKVKEEKLHGQVLKNRSGKLWRSITPLVRWNDISLTGKVGTNTEYAAIHEYGGQTKAHMIMPKKGRALAFRASWGPGQGKGGLTVLRSVSHPGSKIPERSFLRTALNEMEPEIRAKFEDALLQVIRR
jgi:phage gpG-like protein